MLQIASWVNLWDVLSLARSCRPFRDVLMSKTSVLVWQRAHEMMDVPKCPSDLSEPQFAFFLTERMCHVGRSKEVLINVCLTLDSQCCHSLPSIEVVPALRVQLCTICYRKKSALSSFWSMLGLIWSKSQQTYLHEDYSDSHGGRLS